MREGRREREREGGYRGTEKERESEERRNVFLPTQLEPSH